MSTDRYVTADTVSEAWIAALAAGEAAGRKGVHLAVRIDRPEDEVAEIRALADELAAQRGKKDIDTVRNTIYPQGWAERFPEPADLGEHYRKRYALIRKHPENRHGTYFGRLVAYPRGPRGDWQNRADQLEEIVRRLREEHGQNGSRKSSRYELNVFNEQWDTLTMGFPCLSFVSVHTHAGRLHMQATYRNESLVARGYGNFLGLGQLLGYIARATDFECGELLVQAGHWEVDAPKTHVVKLLARA